MSFHIRKKSISIVLSIAAVIISSIQPISTLFHTARIEIEIENELFVSHYFGNLTFGHFLHIKNSGKASQAISSVHYYIEKKDEKFRKYLTVQCTNEWEFSDNHHPKQYPFFDMYLTPDQSFSKDVLVYETPTQSQQQQMSIIEKDIIDNIRSKDTLKHYLHVIKEKHEVDDTLWQKINRIVETNILGFTIGDYRLIVLAYDKNDKLIASNKVYSFTIFESDLKQMNAITAAYKYGGNGIYYHDLKESLSCRVRLFAEKNDHLREKLLYNSREFDDKNQLPN